MAMPEGMNQRRWRMEQAVLLHSRHGARLRVLLANFGDVLSTEEITELWESEFYDASSSDGVSERHEARPPDSDASQQHDRPNEKHERRRLQGGDDG